MSHTPQHETRPSLDALVQRARNSDPSIRVTPGQKLRTLCLFCAVRLPTLWGCRLLLGLLNQYLGSAHGFWLVLPASPTWAGVGLVVWSLAIGMALDDGISWDKAPSAERERESKCRWSKTDVRNSLIGAAALLFGLHDYQALGPTGLHQGSYLFGAGDYPKDFVELVSSEHRINS